MGTHVEHITQLFDAGRCGVSIAVEVDIHDIDVNTRFSFRRNSLNLGRSTQRARTLAQTSCP